MDDHGAITVVPSYRTNWSGKYDKVGGCQSVSQSVPDLQSLTLETSDQHQQRGNPGHFGQEYFGQLTFRSTIGINGTWRHCDVGGDSRLQTI